MGEPPIYKIPPANTNFGVQQACANFLQKIA
jgi:hypothetical protein